MTDLQELEDTLYSPYNRYSHYSKHSLKNKTPHNLMCPKCGSHNVDTDEDNMHSYNNCGYPDSKN